MGLEVTTTISGLVATNPVGATDPKSQGDDHLRLIKNVLKTTFPNFTGVLDSTEAEIDAAVSGLFTSTDAGAGVGPTVIADRNSATPAVDDFIGAFTFRGRDSGGNATDYARLVAQIKDPTDLSEDSVLFFQHMVGGVLTNRLQLHATGATVTGALAATTLQGELNSGSITAGFGSIDVGADPITGGLFTGTRFSAGRGIISNLAYYFEADSNTGIYSPAENEMSIVTGGSSMIDFLLSSIEINAATDINSTLDVTGAMSVGGALTGAAATFSGAVAAAGLTISGATFIDRIANTSVLVISGGAAGNGAHLELYGGSHASLASQAFYEANQHNFRTQAGTLRATLNLSGDFEIVGDFLAAAGSASAPAFTFASDSNTGMYRIGENILGFSTASTEAARLDASGNFTAAGTISSSQAFTGNASFAVLANTGGAGTVLLRPNGPSSSSGQMSVNSAGNVTINGTLTVTG